MKRIKSSAILKSISGESIPGNRALINVKIHKLEGRLNVFVIKNKKFAYDLLLGIDAIRQFRLLQDDKLRIFQRVAGKRIERVQTANAKPNKSDQVRVVNFNEYISVSDFEANLDHLPPDKKKRVLELIKKHEAVFARNKYDIGTVEKHEAQIRLTEKKFVGKKPYRTSIPDQKEIEEQVGRLLENGLIEESSSPFAAPVTLAFKREDGRRSRLCIDFRDLNRLLVPEDQPFPRIEDVLIKAGKAKWLTKVDLNSAFWSIPIRRRDRKKTGFVTQTGHFQWKVLPFGLKISPAIFQRVLSSIIRKHKLNSFCVNYIDDVLIFSNTFEEHLSHVDKLMGAIQSEGFRLKLLKCSFAQQCVQYLGHTIAQNHVSPINDNLKSIREFKRPKNAREVRRWLGKINFYHKFIEKASEKLEPLHNLLRKGKQFKWTEECNRSFEQTKEHLCSSPVLAIYDQDKEVFIFTDASDHGAGAVLKQPGENGVLHPVAYFSKRWSPSQRKASVIYKECLAIKEAISFWKFWLIGREFQVASDHKPLEQLRVRARTDEPLGDLVFYLSQFNFKIKYVPGPTNIEADSLSRSPVLENFEQDDRIRLVNLVKLEQILDDQRLNEREIESAGRTMRENGIAYKLLRNRRRIFVSRRFGEKIIDQVHHLYGHIGAAHLLHKIRPYYYFKHLDRLVEEYVRKCEICRRNKSRKPRDCGLLSRLGPAVRPFQIISIDTIGGFGGSGSPKKYIHLAVDHFTRFGWLLTSSSCKASEFVRLLRPIVETGQVEIVLSDQYSANYSKQVRKFLEDRNVRLVFTSVDWASSNGLNERLGQTLVNRVRCRRNERRATAWPKIAESCMREYNATRHSVTGFAPSYLMTGERSEIVPEELLVRTDLAADREVAFENSRKDHKRNKTRVDRRRRPKTFEPGELVYVHNGNRINRGKLEEVRVGPVRVGKRISSSMYLVDCGGRKSDTVHAGALTPFVR